MWMRIVVVTIVAVRFRHQVDIGAGKKREDCRLYYAGKDLEWVDNYLHWYIERRMIVRTYRRLFDPEFGSFRDLS